MIRIASINIYTTFYIVCFKYTDSFIYNKEIEISRYKTYVSERITVKLDNGTFLQISQAFFISPVICLNFPFAQSCLVHVAAVEVTSDPSHQPHLLSLNHLIYWKRSWIFRKLNTKSLHSFFNLHDIIVSTFSAEATSGYKY